MHNTNLTNDSIGNSNTCGGFCPRCDGTMITYIKPINRIGIKLFLVDSFGDNYNGLVSLIALSKQLYEFENVGQLAYKRDK